jgi:murein L,D-transpeptidase YcbB/YkuD
MSGNDPEPQYSRAPRSRSAPDRSVTALPAPARLFRRASLAGGAISLAAWALAGCAAPEGMTPQPPSPEPGEDLARLRDGADPVVAGEALDGPLLRRFYARRGFEPVWATRQAQAVALAEAVLRSSDHGLDPERFQAGLLRRMSMFPPLRRELLLSHAVLTYAEALAYGAVPVGRRKDSEDLAPEPVDVAAVLDAGLDSTDPVAAIEALAPATPTYRALREALRQHRSGGAVGNDLAERRQRMEANLERQRWLPRQLPGDRVWVNVADQLLVLYRDDRPVFTTPVVVGEETERKQSPEFQTMIEGAFLNPPWVIPADIVAAEILPKLDRDPQFLIRNNIVLRPNGEAEQAPGPTAGLGVIMFDMPNRFDVYLHDTPDKAAFDRENRRISNGCIRVHKPLDFAALVMGERLDVIHEKVATGATIRKPLPKPIPVFVLYQTAFASDDHRLDVRPDFYGRDATVWRRLQKHPEAVQAPGAGRAAAIRRGASPRRTSAR